ncbi:MAG: YcxB family protein [Gemmatimonadota bacterium]
MALDIAYEPTFRDFLSLNRWIVRRRWRAVRWLSAFLLTAFLVSPLLFRDLAAQGFFLPYARSLAILAVPAAFLGLLPAALFLAARNRWNAAPEIREPRRFVFSEEGVAVTGRTFSGQVAWSHVTGAESHRGLFILKTNQNLYYLLSEKGFGDEADRKAFTSLVRRKVSPTFGRSSVLGRVKFLEPAQSLDRR